MPDKSLPLARRMRDIEPFHVMELLARARELEAQGRSIVHMEIGEPDFPTPRPICDAGIRALEKGELFYTPALGLPQLREAIARFLPVDAIGVEVSASRIIVTIGGVGRAAARHRRRWSIPAIRCCWPIPAIRATGISCA